MLSQEDSCSIASRMLSTDYLKTRERHAWHFTARLWGISKVYVAMDMILNGVRGKLMGLESILPPNQTPPLVIAREGRRCC
jgi:hypothetical protein